ncbi:DMT family transporter [Polymorphum gilvum]|uniref:Permease, DMT superfamily n=1 Tax=Polymorphum gilvum (strain LMG 25793 / CGMCC 1.9160 / SL003B-26A1) TaxID=991905 RepID=F2IW45_POLGS|nr:DMT family transporter [Polymorphum gilvum]ADZ71430.1 Permease, DMT superfamily [Polymorphum gilvum SL003B-26A1]
MIATTRRLGASFFNRPVLMLFIAMLSWGGNTIAGRLAIGEVSPFVLVFLRWLIVSILMTSLLYPRIRAEWPTMRPRLGVMMLMALFGFVAFNMLFYIAAYTTTAINLGILQGAMPILVLVGTVLVFRARVLPLQILGILATMVGVALVATHGDLSALGSLSINPGDGIMFLACIFYAGYTLALRNRPRVSGLVFFSVLSIFAAICSVPALAYEMASGGALWPTPDGWLIVLFVSLFPSCLAQIFFMRAVELIGPGRAGVFINLVPIFSALLAVAILSEPFHLHHGAALVLVLGGIWLSERRSALA